MQMCRLVSDYRVWTGTVESEIQIRKGKSVRELRVWVCVLLLSLLLFLLCLCLHVIILSGLLRCNNVSIIYCTKCNVNVWRLFITMVTVGMQEYVFYLLLMCSYCCWQQYVHSKRCHGNSALVRFIIIKQFYVAVVSITDLRSMYNSKY